MKQNYFLKSKGLNIAGLMLFITSIFTYSQDMTYTISNPEDLKEVIYKPGDVIILENGTYETDERMIFLGSGTEDKPVTFRAETPGGVIFTGGPRLTIGGESDGPEIATGEYLVVDGFHWKGGYGASNFIEFRNGSDFAHHSTLQNCAIDGLTAEPSELSSDLANEQITKQRWIVLYGSYNSVLNCSFMNKNTAGAIILGEYSYNAFPEVPDGQPEVNESCNEVGHTISNNYFYNFEKLTELYGRKADGSELSNAGDSETIRLGTSSYQMVNSNATVSNNYFVQSDGENEIITNKSKGNTYTNNTFRRSRGSLVLRHGSNATVEGNYFLGEDVDGTGGVRISDSNHNINNNYIQDVITVNNFAKWNNGITFIGGGADADVACTSDDVSNGYQKSLNINLSNNTIVNSNAPLYYNINTDHDNDITGSVSNNLFYYADSDPSITNIISGDTDTSYDRIGKTLDYSGNEYKGTTLGETDADTDNGFSLEVGITASANGEIFDFIGTDKGANMGTYEPTSDAMVGFGVGACFLNNLGELITGGDCTIVVPETLSVSSLPTVSSAAGNYDVSVNANVSWTAKPNNSWISIDTDSGTGSTTISIIVTENIELTSRTGTVTFTQDPGGNDIERTLTVNQEAADITTGLILINDGSVDDNVVVHSVFHEEITSSKNNIAIHSLDKDIDTQWSGNNTADASEINADTNIGEIIYDLGGSYNLQLVNYMATNGKTYEFKILVSSTTSDDSAFSNPFGASNLECATQNDEFTNFLLPSVTAETKFVKIIGYGQPARPSTWNTIVEIEFYGTSSDPNGDDDNDGVLNKDDVCPNTGSGETVDGNGCSVNQLDDDEDGIINGEDACPETPLGESVDSNGCSESQLDDDNDGVSNKNDICSNTPNGESVNANGCSESQLDDDNDGVMNNLDQCNNTTVGYSVNEIGCFELSANNFEIKTLGETCPDKTNGKLIINAIEGLIYTTTIDGVEYTFTDTLEIENLEPKAYEFCIAVDGEVFEQCFNVVVEEGSTITGKTSISSNKLNINITKGTAPFKVYINGQELFKTMNASFSVDATSGDLIEVKTEIICEGVFSKQMDSFENITAYPNPTSGRLTISLPTDKNDVEIELYNMHSQLVSSKNYNLTYGKVTMDIEDLPAGIYMAKITGDTPVIVRIVKK